MRLIVVGAPDNRRQYFQQAGAALGAAVTACSWNAYPDLRQPGDRVKLDPLPFGKTDLNALPAFVRTCQAQLERFSGFSDIVYLNTPQAIAAALDKAETRKRLVAAGVPMPPTLSDTPIQNADELVETMKDRRMYRVFVKPRYGSGAAGVMAYARTPGGREVLYTALQEKNGCFYNTRRIRRSEDPEINHRLLNTVLSLDAMVEGWIPKTRHNGLCYDLRVVCLQDEILLMVARGSRTPITNLHINNMALDVDALFLSPAVTERIRKICALAMAQFPGLACAGLDVLLTPAENPCEPSVFVIEVNGQGDLMESDIFSNNRIYKRQVKYLNA